MPAVSNLRETHEYNPNFQCVQCKQELGQTEVIYHKAEKDKHYFHKKCIVPLIIKNYFGHLHCPACDIELEGSSIISYKDKKKLHLKNIVSCMKVAVITFALMSVGLGSLFFTFGVFKMPITELVTEAGKAGYQCGTAGAIFMFVTTLGRGFLREIRGVETINAFKKEQAKAMEYSSYL